MKMQYPDAKENTYMLKAYIVQYVECAVLTKYVGER